jgi:tetratricopeptide (TPR) repeat protein
LAKLQDLIAALVSEQTELPLLFIGLTRPSLLERRPLWASQPPSQRLTLSPLNKRDSRDLAREILQKVTEPPKALRDLLVERAEGNPLFMEALVQMLIEDRVILKDSPEVWRVEESRLAGLRVPPTLKGLLQTRSDTLLYPEKLTLQRASVAGRSFQEAALIALDAADDPRSHVGNVSDVLELLTQREFVYRRVLSTAASSHEYAFTQTMLRDLIYESLLAHQRQIYHRAMAKWLSGNERAEERWPTIAEHYAVAGDWDEAAIYFERAGDKAMRVSAFAEALRFYTRTQFVQPATDQLAEQTPSTRIILKQAEAHYRLGDYAEAQAAINSILDSSEIGSQLAHALALLGEINSATGDYGSAKSALTAALPLARAGGDQAVLARVLYALGDVGWRLGELNNAERHLNESITIAREINDTVRTLFALNRLGTVMGALGRVTEETRLYEEVQTLAQQTGNRDRLMTALNNLGTVAQERGNLALAQLYYRQALEIAQEVGVQDSIILYGTNIAYADSKLGNLQSAEQDGRKYLAQAIESGALPWVIVGIFTFAELAHVRGDTDLALALLGLAQNHPAYSRDNRRMAELCQAEWQIDKVTFEAGLSKGATLDFDTVIHELLNA